MIGWLYRSMVGFKVIEPGKNYVLKPCIPEDLKYFEMKIPLLSGSIYLKYENKYNMQLFFIDVPAGVKVEFEYKNIKYNTYCGFNSYCINDVYSE